MKKSLAGIILLFFPSIAFAVDDLNSLVNMLLGLVNTTIPLLFGIATLGFMWGMIKFIYHADDPKARADGKYIMIWGIIALAVMMSVWTLAITLKNSVFPSASTPVPCAGCGEGTLPSTT